LEFADNDQSGVLHLNIWKKVVGILTAGLAFYSLFNLFIPPQKKSKITRITSVAKRPNRIVMKGLRISESFWVNDFELMQVFLCLPNTLSVNNVQFSFFTIEPLMGTDNPFEFQ
jgi:hypothetical protein